MFRITIRVTTNAGKNSIEEEEEGGLKVKVNSPAVDGKANKAVINLLAAYYGVRKSAVSIVKGEKSRDKIIEIAADPKTRK